MCRSIKALTTTNQNNQNNNIQNNLKYILLNNHNLQQKSNCRKSLEKINYYKKIQNEKIYDLLKSKYGSIEDIKKRIKQKRVL